MDGGEIVLFLVVAAGALGGNDLVAIAAVSMLALRAIGFDSLFLAVDRYAIPAGVLFLMVGLLSPFSSGKLGLAAVIRTLTSPAGLIALSVGTLASYLGSNGVKLLTVKPEVMVGLVVGSIVGVSLLGGIPVGPLVAAGFTAFLYQLLKL